MNWDFIQWRIKRKFASVSETKPDLESEIYDVVSKHDEYMDARISLNEARRKGNVEEIRKLRQVLKSKQKRMNDAVVKVHGMYPSDLIGENCGYGALLVLVKRDRLVIDDKRMGRRIYYHIDGGQWTGKRVELY